MPKALKGDIVSHRIQEAECDECSSAITVKLKNAKAFGHRLKAIEYSASYGEWIKLHFYDDTFMQLLPKFALSGKDVKIKPNQKVAYLVTTDGYQGKILSYKQVAYPKDLKREKEYNRYWSSSFESLYELTDKALYLSTPKAGHTHILNLMEEVWHLQNYTLTNKKSPSAVMIYLTTASNHPISTKAIKKTPQANSAWGVFGTNPYRHGLAAPCRACRFLFTDIINLILA